jgi:hypothetical protein
LFLTQNQSKNSQGKKMNESKQFIFLTLKHIIYSTHQKNTLDFFIILLKALYYVKDL